MADVHAKTGIDMGNLSRIERGKQEPKVTQAAALMALFSPDLALTDLAVNRTSPDQLKAA